MRTTFLGVAVAAAVLGIAIGSTSATPDADATAACVENNQLTFDPPLTTGNQSGTITISFQTTCPDLPGLTPGHASGTVTHDYFGSCAFAFTTEGVQAGLIGGTAYLVVRDGLVKTQVLQPDSPCPIASAHGTGAVVK